MRLREFRNLPALLATSIGVAVLGGLAGVAIPPQAAAQSCTFTGDVQAHEWQLSSGTNNVGGCYGWQEDANTYYSFFAGATLTGNSSSSQTWTQLTHSDGTYHGAEDGVWGASWITNYNGSEYEQVNYSFCDDMIDNGYASVGFNTNASRASEGAYYDQYVYAETTPGLDCGPTYSQEFYVDVYGG